MVTQPSNSWLSSCVPGSQMLGYTQLQYFLEHLQTLWNLDLSWMQRPMMSLEGRETAEMSSLCAGHTWKRPSHTSLRLSRFLSLGQTWMYEVPMVPFLYQTATQSSSSVIGSQWPPRGIPKCLTIAFEIHPGRHLLTHRFSSWYLSLMLDRHLLVCIFILFFVFLN